MQKKHILFDLDGTLTDSGAGIIHGFRIVMDHYGLPRIPAEEERTVVGPPLRSSFARFGVSEEQLDEAVRIYRAFYVSEGEFENSVYPGIEDALQTLSNAGHKLYVATSKPEAMSIRILERFGLAKYFTRICGAADDRTRDTKEKVIRYLLDLTQPDGPVIMVGDTVYDIEGASAIGIPSIGVVWGYGDGEQMRVAGADAIAQDAQELCELLLSGTC